MPIRLLLALTLVLPLFGCANFGYYAQAFNGQMDLIGKTRPIDELLADRDTDAALRDKLTTVLEVRDYASRELGLPNNDSYRAYADVGRPYVLWNVFATPEFSLKPQEWCFVITGCNANGGSVCAIEPDEGAPCNDFFPAAGVCNAEGQCTELPITSG